LFKQIGLGKTLPAIILTLQGNYAGIVRSSTGFFIFSDPSVGFYMNQAVYRLSN
jgi:hypothetical protein